MGGIKATANRLVVTRAASGFADVYNRFTGELVVRFTNGRPQGQSIINDVAVTPNGDAYLTEFDDSQLYRIPASELQVAQGRRAAPAAVPRLRRYGLPDPLRKRQRHRRNSGRQVPHRRPLRRRQALPGPAARQAGDQDRPARGPSRGSRRDRARQLRRALRRRVPGGKDRRDPAQRPVQEGNGRLQDHRVPTSTAPRRPRSPGTAYSWRTARSATATTRSPPFTVASIPLP